MRGGSSVLACGRSARLLGARVARCESGPVRRASSGVKNAMNGEPRAAISHRHDLR
jgi:hypothetical protein